MGSSTVLAASAPGVSKEREPAERAELATILACEAFRRSPQISRLLSYLCEKYFEGRAGEIKEYTIAVDVLGRGPEFDPQIDAIVRVDAYHLRKRLKQYYATEGIDHEIHLVLPPGQYTPTFMRRPETDAPIGIAPVEIEIAPELPTAPPHLPAPRSRSWLVPILGTAIVLSAIAILWFAR